MTVQQLVERALTINGRLGIGRGAGPAESGIALGVLNAMLESWALDRLLVTTFLFRRYPLVSGTQSYTIGPSGVFAGARPVMIEVAKLITTINGAEGTLDLKLLSPTEFADIRMKTDTSPVPRSLYNDYNGPNSTLYLYPIPSAVSELELWTWQIGGPYAALTDTVAVAPGYERAIAAALAIETAEHVGRPVTQDMVGQATEAISNVKKLNAARFGIPMEATK